MSNIIEFINAAHEYKNSWNNLKNTAFENINLSVKRGEFLALMGPNGCGKSTLARHINGLLLPTEGKVLIDGMDTRDENKNFDIKRKVAMVFQNPDNQTVTSVVEEEIAFGLENLCIPREQIKNKIKSALKCVEMEGFEKRSTYSLSGGQKQRLALASVFAMNPEIMVLDEPTSMLDPNGRKSVMNIIEKLNKNHNITIVLITHYIEEALAADSVLIMENGQISMSDKPQKIFSNPEFIKSYSYNTLESTQILYFLKEKGYNVSLETFENKKCASEIIKLLENTK